MSLDPDVPIRILLVDDHVIVRQALRLLIESHSDMKVIAEAGGCDEALEKARREIPDLVLLDLDLGSGSGLDIIPQLTALGENVHVLVLTGVQSSEAQRNAVRLGAVGLVEKSQARETLTKAIRKVMAGEVWVDRGTMAQLLHELTHKQTSKRLDTEASRIASLTPREREVIALIAQGFGTQRIANELFISQKTVRNHLASIFSKLMVTDRLELAVFAVRHGLAPQPR